MCGSRDGFKLFGCVLCCSSPSFLRRFRRYDVGDKEGHSSDAGFLSVELLEELPVAGGLASLVPYLDATFDGAVSGHFWVHVAIQAVLSEYETGVASPADH